MLNQKYFNGIGNYLRAEILYRAGISPFTSAKRLFENTPPFTTSEILSTNHKGLILLYLCKAIPQEVLDKGLNKYGNPNEVKLFEEWLR